MTNTNSHKPVSNAHSHKRVAALAQALAKIAEVKPKQLPLVHAHYAH